MLEIVFDSSVKGSLRHGKTYDSDAYKSGAMAFVGKRPSEDELEKMFEGKALGGHSDEVVQLGVFMDIGNIREGCHGASRLEVYHSLYDVLPGHVGDLEGMNNEIALDFKRVMQEIEEDGEIRVWVDHSPSSVCGYYYLCDLLRHSKCKLRKVLMPEYWLEEDSVMKNGGWNCVHAGKFYQFLKYEKDVPKIEVLEKGNRWKELVDENAPLRAVVNGKLISVPVDFYDYLIEQEIQDHPILMGRLLSNLILKYGFGLSDGWYRLRVEEMIKDGVLEIVGVKDENHPYGAIIGRCM